MALIGDRLFTDVLAGNRLGLYTVLVRPIDPEWGAVPAGSPAADRAGLARWVGRLLA